MTEFRFWSEHLIKLFSLSDRHCLDHLDTLVNSNMLYGPVITDSDGCYSFSMSVGEIQWQG